MLIGIKQPIKLEKIKHMFGGKKEKDKIILLLLIVSLVSVAAAVDKRVGERVNLYSQDPPITQINY